MGRFDALTQIQDKSTQKPPEPEVFTQRTEKKPSNTDQKPTSEVKKPEFMKSRNREDEPPTDLPVKYSTLMRMQFIKKIKIHATETDLKDYEVIELALTEYFKKH